MQEVARERGLAGNFRRGAVKAIADYGVPDAGKVHANLVGAAGADAHFEQRKALQAPQDPVLGPRLAAAGEAGGHADALLRVARDGFFDAAAVWFDVAVD